MYGRWLCLVWDLRPARPCTTRRRGGPPTPRARPALPPPPRPARSRRSARPPAPEEPASGLPGPAAPPPAPPSQARSRLPRRRRGGVSAAAAARGRLPCRARHTLRLGRVLASGAGRFAGGFTLPRRVL